MNVNLYVLANAIVKCQIRDEFQKCKHQSQLVLYLYANNIMTVNTYPPKFTRFSSQLKPWNFLTKADANAITLHYILQQVGKKKKQVVNHESQMTCMLLITRKTSAYT